MAVEPIELHTSAPVSAQSSAQTRSCACGHEDESELGAIAPGFSLDLMANHNPLPLIARLEAKQPGDFTISYLSDGPDEWKLRFTRV